MSRGPIPSSPSAFRILLVQNPTAGARSGTPLVTRLADLLGDQGLIAETVSELGEYTEKVATYRAEGELLAVVAAGGDGTVSLVVNHTPPGTPVAILPLGTENLLAKQLGITPDPDLVCETVVHGDSVKLDAGEAGGRLFLLMAGCGFDAEVVHRLHAARTGHIHHLSYAKPILDSIRSYEYPELRVYCGPKSEGLAPEAGSSTSEPITARWVFVVNMPRYAGGLRIAPRANGSDGLLDVCAFKEGSLWNGLRYLSGVALGQHEGWSDFVTFRAAHLRIEAAQPVPYQLDGDPGGSLPVEIRVLPARATLLVPPRGRGESKTIGTGLPAEHQPPT